MQERTNEPVKKTIDGQDYLFHGLSPRKASRTLLRVVKLLGPGVTGLNIKNIGDAKSILSSNIDIGSIVSGLATNLNIDETEAIINIYLEQVICMGFGEVSKCFDIIFKGRIKHMYKVVYESLKVEYADFFDGPGG